MNRAFLLRRYDWKGKLFSRNHFYPLLPCSLRFFLSTLPSSLLPNDSQFLPLHVFINRHEIVPGIARKTIQQETRVHTGVKSGLPIDSSQPLVDSPSPMANKTVSIRMKRYHPQRRVTRNFHEGYSPFFSYLPLPFFTTLSRGLHQPPLSLRSLRFVMLRTHWPKAF